MQYVVSKHKYQHLYNRSGTFLIENIIHNLLAVAD